MTELLKSTVVMPECVAATISSMPFSPMAATAFMSPASTDLNGSLSFHSGCWFACFFTSSMAKTNWLYSGCSIQSVPSLSKVRDALLGLHEVGPALLGHLGDEVDDRSAWSRHRSTTERIVRGACALPRCRAPAIRPPMQGASSRCMVMQENSSSLETKRAPAMGARFALQLIARMFCYRGLDLLLHRLQIEATRLSASAGTRSPSVPVLRPSAARRRSARIHERRSH